MKKEIWLPIRGYEGLYEVSSFGKVRSLNYHRTGKTKVLNPGENGCGYFKVVLCKNRRVKQYLVHRLVAEAFIPNWFDYSEVNHRDENKTNNHIDNLEWCDSKYNNNYGSRNQRVSEKNTNGKLSKIVLQLTKTGELVHEWPSINEADRNGFDKGAVSSCCNGKLQSHKGFIWRYKEFA